MSTTKKTFFQVAVPVPMSQCFDYLAPMDGTPAEKMQPGLRVRVPFQRRELVGIFMGSAAESDIPADKLKRVSEVLDVEPIISSDMMQLCLWAADYYHYPIGEVLMSALPVLLRQGKPAEISQKQYAKWMKVVKSHTPAAPTVILNSAQQVAVDTIQKLNEQFQVFLLDGVTGSGKTEVYLQAITDILKKQKQVLVLVPEIGLTPQTIQRFRERFSEPVVALHSKLSEKERLNAWLLAKSGDAKIVIGTRSAIFSTFKNLGLIIVDEEHDLSFKQQEGFRYHARDVAIMRAHFSNIPIVLGSATPSLETLHNARQGRYQHLVLPMRAGDAKPPVFRVLDIRNAVLEEGLSKPLLEEMAQHLQQGNQVMLFLNRRGFAPVLMCHTCGWMAKCKRCDARMTYHQNPKRLHCHHCDSRKNIDTRCESCGSKELFALGLGTERLEQVLTKHFPTFSIARIDRDSTRRKGKMEELLEGIQNGAHQILIGTQMLAKGHHFPNVTLVAIVDADSGFFSTDFRAMERMGQLLLQVSGRAGRVEKTGTVLIQTHHPDHPLLHLLLQKSYQDFAATLLDERSQAILPPFSFFALFRAEAHQANHAEDFLQQVRKISDNARSGIHLLGPIPAPMPRRAGRHRMQLLVQAKQRPLLQKFLKFLLTEMDTLASKQKVRWSLDVDPLEMY